MSRPPIAISAHTNRVPVVDGHTEVVSVGFARRVTPSRGHRRAGGFRAPAEVAALPSTPARPIEVGSPSRPAAAATGPRSGRRHDGDRGAGAALPAAGLGWCCWRTTPSAGRRGRRCRTRSCWCAGDLVGPMTVRLALVGDGKMGRARRGARDWSGATRSAPSIDGAENRTARRSPPNGSADAEVALEFTRPEAAPANLLRLAALGLPTVSGTTGWSIGCRRSTADGRPRTARRCSTVPTSLSGVQLFLRAAEDLARQFRGARSSRGSSWSSHHAAKRDAPSGTALAAAGRGRAARIPRGEFPITRSGADSCPGPTRWSTMRPSRPSGWSTWPGAGRRSPPGRCSAAEWLRGREGVFTFDQMLFGEDR